MQLPFEAGCADWCCASPAGALISATDPVATLSVFAAVDVPPLLFNLVFGESVLNDAVAIVLFRTLVGLPPCLHVVDLLVARFKAEPTRVSTSCWTPSGRPWSNGLS